MERHITSVEDILTPEQIREYHEAWRAFSHLHRNNWKPLPPYTVRSGLPVIGPIFRFEDYPIFRAHLFKNRLRKYDPYFTSTEYPNPFLHLQHYFIALEQMGHVCLDMFVPDYCRYSTHDRFDTDNPLEMNNVVFFKPRNTSIEFVPDLRIGKNKYAGRLHLTFYEDEHKNKEGVIDRTNISLQRWHFQVIGRLRKYIRTVEDLKRGKKESFGSLINQIYAQELRHIHLIHPRTNLPSVQDLVSRLQQGEIPEEQLHDFFSLWDK